MKESGTDTGGQYKYKKVIPILGIGKNTGKQYRHRRSVRILKNNIILENGSSQAFKLFITLEKRIVKSSSRETVKSMSEHQNGAKQCWGQGQRTVFNH